MHAHRHRLTTFTLLALAGMTACGDSEDGPARVSGDTPEPGGTAVLAEGFDLAIPSPIAAQTELDGNLSSDILYMGLLRTEWEDGRLVYRTADENPMSLAKAYEYLPPDSSAIRFHLRTDARWSDGVPITARDVQFTFQMVAEPELASPRSADVEQLDSVIVENDSTVVFRFETRYPEMLFHTGIDIIPRHVFEGRSPAEFRSHPALQNPAGNLVVSGPFMIGEWRKNQQIVLVRNPHFRPQPHLERIIIRVIPEPTTRLAELRTGAIDMAKRIDPAQIPALQAQAPHVRFEYEKMRNYDYVAYNPSGYAPFGDADIRRALGLGIDVQQIIDALQMSEFAVPAGGPYPPIFADLYDPELTPPLPYEPDEARRILESKGWVDTDGDGIREKDGAPFRFTLVTNSSSQIRGDASQIIQQQWRLIGVDAQLRGIEFNTFMSNLFAHEYQAALGGWIVSLSPDITPLFASDGPFNITGHGSPAADSLFRLALRQRTEEAATQYWRRGAAELVEDQPYTWLYYYDTVDGVNERLKGMRVDTYGPYQNVWEWWIPRSQQGRASASGPAPDTSAAAGGN